MGACPHALVRIQRLDIAPIKRNAILRKRLKVGRAAPLAVFRPSLTPLPPSPPSLPPQMPAADKCAPAHYVIDTGAGQPASRAAVHALV